MAKGSKKKDPAAVSLGHKGGVKGGPARAAALSKIERAKIDAAGGRAKAKAKKGTGDN